MATQPHSQVFERLEAYPWDSDREFQTGLTAILGAKPSPDQTRELTLRARCFYYARKEQIPVDFDAYKAWLADGPSSSPSQPSASSQEPSENSQQSSQTSQPSTMAPSSLTPSSTSSTLASTSSTLLSSSSSRATPVNGETKEAAPYPASFAEIIQLITTGQPIPGVRDIPPTVLEGQGTAPSLAPRRKPWEKDDVQLNTGGTFGDH